MNKVFRRIGLAFTGIAMALGTGVAAAANGKDALPVNAAAGDKVSFSYTTSSSKKLSTTYGANTLADDKINGLSISCTTAKTSGTGVIQNTYNTSFGGQQMTTNANRDTTVTFTFGNPWSGNHATYKEYTQINSVTFTGVAGSGTTYTVSCTIDGVAATGDNTGFDATKTTTTFTPASGHEKGIIVITVAYVSGQKGWYFDKLGINAEVPDTGLEDKQITYTSASDVALQTAGTTTSQIEGLNVDGCTFTSNNTNVATVSNSGLITAVGKGSTTITISHANDATYHYLAATVNVTVTKVYDYSTELDVLTFAQAREATPASGDSEKMMVVGHIDSITNASNGHGYLANTSVDYKLQIYYMYDVDGNKGSSMDNPDEPVVDDVVVLEGVFCFYNTSWEIKNAVVRQLNGTVYNYPVTISSIEVKTAPTKTEYRVGADFDPTGLVITVNYSDSTTEDVPYNNETKNNFSFDPEVITEAGDVTITYGEKDCVQAVTLATITDVTGVASAPTEVYQNGSIKASDVTLNVKYSDNSVGTVTPDSITVDTTEVRNHVQATATYNAATTTKTATFFVDVVAAPVYVEAVDNIDRELTGINSGSGYGSWSNKQDKTDAVYAGNTGGGNDSVQMNSTSTGLYSATSGGKLYSVSVSWNTNTSNARSIKVYGKDTAFTSISTEGATLLGTITKGTSTQVVDDDFEYDYVLITGAGSAVYIDEIVVTWKVEGTDNPMTAAPVLTLGKASISIGKTTSLSVGTTPIDSDELLLVTSSDDDVASVSGSGKEYTITGLSVGSSTITVAGKQSSFQSNVIVTVTEAVKSYEDKVLTPEALGLSGSYDASDTEKTFENVPYIEKNVMKSNGFQFKGGAGYIYNDEALYGSNNIKSITLVMQGKNTATAKVYEGSSKNPDTEVDPKADYVADGVNTYVFNESKPFFKIAAGTNATYIKTIIIELEDSASPVLQVARQAARSILSDLNGLCGDNGSGTVTQSQWNTLSSHLDTILDGQSEARNLLKNANRCTDLNNLVQGGAEIENAMFHYDAVVEKFGFSADTSITNANSALVSFIDFKTTANSNIATVLVITLVSTGIIVGCFMLIRRRKED